MNAAYGMPHDSTWNIGTMTSALSASVSRIVSVMQLCMECSQIERWE